MLFFKSTARGAAADNEQVPRPDLDSGDNQSGAAGGGNVPRITGEVYCWSNGAPTGAADLGRFGRWTNGARKFRKADVLDYLEREKSSLGRPKIDRWMGKYQLPTQRERSELHLYYC